jgi:hypothetical protein
VDGGETRSGAKNGLLTPLDVDRHPPANNAATKAHFAARFIFG